MEASRLLPYCGAAYDELLDTLYATPVDQQCWPAFLEQLVRISRSRSARMLVLDRAAAALTAANEHIVIALTQEGGHVHFPQGWWPRNQSWSDNVTLAFLEEMQK